MICLGVFSHRSVSESNAGNKSDIKLVSKSYIIRVLAVFELYIFLY